MDIHFEADVVVSALEYLEAARGNVWAARLNVREQALAMLVEAVAETIRPPSEPGGLYRYRDFLSPGVRVATEAAIAQTYLFTAAFPQQAADFFQAIGLQSLVRPDEDRRCAETYLQLASVLKQQLQALDHELRVRLDSPPG